MILTAQEAADRAAEYRNAKLEKEREVVATTIKAAVEKGDVSCTVKSMSPELMKELRELGYEVNTGFSDPRDPYTLYSIKWAWGGQ